jgi:hypothetical protein
VEFRQKGKDDLYVAFGFDDLSVLILNQKQLTECIEAKNLDFVKLCKEAYENYLDESLP